jgi:hypothetical protein
LVVDVLAISSRRLSKVAVAIGGFLIFVGVMVVGVFVLVLTGYISIGILEGTLENPNYRMSFWGLLFAIGVLDVVSGIILRHR